MEKAGLVVPHECFLVDSVEGGKLADGEQGILVVHFLNLLLTVQLLYGLS